MTNWRNSQMQRPVKFDKNILRFLNNSYNTKKKTEMRFLYFYFLFFQHMKRIYIFKNIIWFICKDHELIYLFLLIVYNYYLYLYSVFINLTHCCSRILCLNWLIVTLTKSMLFINQKTVYCIPVAACLY